MHRYHTRVAIGLHQAKSALNKTGAEIALLVRILLFRPFTHVAIKVPVPKIRRIRNHTVNAARESLKHAPHRAELPEHAGAQQIILAEVRDGVVHGGYVTRCRHIEAADLGHVLEGVEQLGRSNQSIYSPVLKALIDEFVAEHADRIDTDRIVVAGLSNGGFMTLRLCADYPDFFAAGLPCCAPWYNATDEDVAALAKTPLWFTHSKGDELVSPQQTVLPLTARLRDAGANVHLTYFSYVEDLTGRHDPRTD